jgi:hypothetical protein
LVYFPVLVCFTDKNLATLPKNHSQAVRQRKFFVDVAPVKNERVGITHSGKRHTTLVRY